MHELALFAGAGGGILGGKLLGWKTVCAVEINPACREILAARQDDECLTPFPIWDDVRTFDGKPWRGLVDIITGGFPCQDISAAGLGAGIDGKRSGLWMEMARIIREVGPRFVLVENSAMLTHRGLGRILGALAAMGYDARWGVLGADAAGYPHRRARMWVAANSVRGEWWAKPYDGASGRMGWLEQSPARHADWEGTIAQFRGDRYGLADRLDRTDAIRNGQVPDVAALAWLLLSGAAYQGGRIEHPNHRITNIEK
jgi:DNA (cytosine-5)-methyltransferase 1